MQTVLPDSSSALDEEGCFVYEVIHGDGLAVRNQPSVDNEYRTAMSFEKGDLVAVDYIRYDRRRRRRRPVNNNDHDDDDDDNNNNKNNMDGPFLRLADCSGWLFEHKNGTAMMARVTVETGLWAFYVDNVPYGQALRRHPCDRHDMRVVVVAEEDEEEEDVVYQPLQKIYCDRQVRHPVTHVGFYRVQGGMGGGGGGWVFDRRPDEEFGCMLLDERQVQTGLFAFVARHSMSVRREPTVSDACRTLRAVHEGEIVVGDIVRDHPYHRFHGPFLRLTDGSGWLFQQKQGHVAMEPLEVETGLWKLQVVTSPGVLLLRQPIDRVSCFNDVGSYDWKTDVSYKQGEVVTCDRRIVPDEALMDETVSSFYRVQDTNGWIVDRRGDQVLMDLVKDWTTPRATSNSILPPDGWNPYFVRGIATTVDGLAEIDFNPTTCLLSFLSLDGVTIKVYYATRTVGTSLQQHQQQGSSPNNKSKSKVQQFRQNCSPSDLLEIFKSPLAYHSIARNTNGRQKNDPKPQSPTTRATRKKDSRSQSPTQKAGKKGKDQKPKSPIRFLRNKDAAAVDAVAVDTPYGLGILVEQEEVLRQKLLDCMNDEQRLQTTRLQLLTSIRSFDLNRAKEAAKMQTSIQVRQAEEEAAALEEDVQREPMTHTTTLHTFPSRDVVDLVVVDDDDDDDYLAQESIDEQSVMKQRTVTFKPVPKGRI